MRKILNFDYTKDDEKNKETKAQTTKTEKCCCCNGCVKKLIKCKCKKINNKNEYAKGNINRLYRSIPTDEGDFDTTINIIEKSETRSYDDDDDDDDDKLSYIHGRRRSQKKSIFVNSLINKSSNIFIEEDERIRTNDPFIKRDINIELVETLQAFNLLIFGKPLVLFIIKQLGKENRDSYWNILKELMNALPYPVAIESLKNPDTFNVLRYE